MKKRIISVLSAVLVLMSVVSVTAFAVTSAETGAVSGIYAAASDTRAEQEAPADGEGYIIDKENGKIIPLEGYELRASEEFFNTNPLTLRYNTYEYFIRKAGTDELKPSPEVRFVIHGHNLVKVDASPAQKYTPGNKEYYQCKDSEYACGEYFEDAEGNIPIENIENWKAKGGNGYIPSLYETDDNYCEKCGYVHSGFKVGRTFCIIIRLVNTIMGFLNIFA